MRKARSKQIEVSSYLIKVREGDDKKIVIGI